MEAEEAMFCRRKVLGEFGDAVLEQGGDPGIGSVGPRADMTIATSAAFINHPIDGFATAALPKEIATGCMVHLGLCK